MRMGPNTNESEFPADEELLLPFERQMLSVPYRNYLRTKRNNTFASIQRLPHQWKRFDLIDQVWLREIEDLNKVVDISHVVVVTLFIRGYARVRLMMELAFAGCTTEAADLLRGGIESVAQANKIYHEPHLVEVWLKRDQDKSSLDAYRSAFEREKKTGLFAGLPGLHHYWSHFSELGHSSALSVMGRITPREGSPNEVAGDFQFFETNPHSLTAVMNALFDCVRHMEQVLFDCFHERLNLDVRLVRMRISLEKMNGRLSA
jgi:hypothetical protein